MSVPNRTQLLVTGARYDTRRQKAVGMACGTIVLFTLLWTGLCTGLMSLDTFLGDPVLATLSAIAAVVLGIPYAVMIVWLDRNQREPPLLLLSAFMWGAVVATMFSFIVNTFVGVVLYGLTGSEVVSGLLTASFSAPLIEELSKGAAMVVLYVLFRNHLDNVLDGVVYGALIGLGFAVFENFHYYTSQPNLFEAMKLVFMRGVITSPGTHACFTAITGAGFGLMRVSRVGAGRWAYPPIAVALAMFVHFSWNSFAMFFLSESLLETLLIGLPTAVVVIQLPFVGLVLLVSALALWHERSIIERYLGEEGGNVVLPDDLPNLVPARKRTLKGMRLFLSFDFRGWNLFRKRCNHLVELAFEKWHMDKEAALGEEVAELHARRVVHLRKQLIELGPAPE